MKRTTFIGLLLTQLVSNGLTAMRSGRVQPTAPTIYIIPCKKPSVIMLMVFYFD